MTCVCVDLCLHGMYKCSEGGIQLRLDQLGTHAQRLHVVWQYPYGRPAAGAWMPTRQQDPADLCAVAQLGCATVTDSRHALSTADWHRACRTGALWTQQNWLAGGLTIEAQVRPGYGTSVHAQVTFHGSGAPAACANIRALQMSKLLLPCHCFQWIWPNFESDSARYMSGVFTGLQQCGPPHNSRRRQLAHTLQHSAPCHFGRQIPEAWFYHPHPCSRNRNSHRLLRARQVCTVSGWW